MARRKLIGFMVAFGFFFALLFLSAAWAQRTGGGSIRVGNWTVGIRALAAGDKRTEHVTWMWCPTTSPIGVGGTEDYYRVLWFYCSRVGP